MRIHAQSMRMHHDRMPFTLACASALRSGMNVYKLITSTPHLSPLAAQCCLPRDIPRDCVRADLNCSVLRRGRRQSPLPLVSQVRMHACAYAAR